MTLGPELCCSVPEWVIPCEHNMLTNILNLALG